MSEDEDTTPAAEGVPSETDAADEAAAGETATPEPESGADSQPDVDDGDVETDTPATESVIARVASHDEELASAVEAIVEETDSEEASEQIESLEQTVAAKAEEVRELEEAVADLESRLKRKQADFQNYKKRAKKRQEQLKERATEDLVERLLGVRDNLNRALNEEGGDVESLRDGVEMTLREFDRVLTDENVSEIDPEPGAAVDPQRHEVMVQVDSDQPEGTIAEVFTPGYEMGEKVIQSAQVTVSNGELAETPDESGADADTGDGKRTDDGDDQTATPPEEADGAQPHPEEPAAADPKDD